MQGDPEVFDNEVFCHWTANEDEYPNAKNDEDNFQINISHPESRLLIGATPTLEQKKCVTPVEKVELESGQGYSLRPYGTRHSSKYRDTQTFQVTSSATVGLPLATTGLNLSYGEAWKMRSTNTLKEDAIGSWLHEPHRRNPQIVKQRIGVEISACTHNARRLPLHRILGSETLQRYLSCIDFLYQDNTCSEAWKYAFQSDDPNAFLHLYYEKKDWRQDLGTMMAICLKTLEKTGFTEDGNLEALWMSETTSWAAVFIAKRRFFQVPPRRSHTEEMGLEASTSICDTPEVAATSPHPSRLLQLSGRSTMLDPDHVVTVPPPKRHGFFEGWDNLQTREVEEEACIDRHGLQPLDYGHEDAEDTAERCVVVMMDRYE
ncbi:MAG: hypothetical protein M1822_008150 [Bathelium mastoideum]|nr:MAG: hypothetical protein M1822_008150 [Bathelium mastoideum]